MSRTLSPSTKKPYGLARVAAAWGVPRSTYYAQRSRRNNPGEARKRGPRTSFTDAELTGRIRDRRLAVYRGRPPEVLGASPGGGRPDFQDPSARTDAGSPAAGASTPSGSGRQEGPHRDHHHRLPESDVGHRRHGNRDARRRPGHRVRRPRPLHGRVCGHSCRQASDALRGPGATPARRPGTLHWLPGQHRLWTSTPARSRRAVHERRLPERDPVPGHGIVAGVRWRARRQRLYRTLLQNAQGAIAPGPTLPIDPRTGAASVLSTTSTG